MNAPERGAEPGENFLHSRLFNRISKMCSEHSDHFFFLDGNHWNGQWFAKMLSTHTGVTSNSVMGLITYVWQSGMDICV